MHFRQHGQVALGTHHLARLAHLQLLGADVVVLLARHGGLGGRITQDLRVQEHHQVALAAVGAAVAEQVADHRDVAQRRHLVDRVLVVAADEAAQHQGGIVADQHRGLQFALVGHQVHRAADRRRERRHFLVQIQAHGVALVHVRRDLQGEADVLALNGLEGIGRQVGAAIGGGVGVLAGDERHLLRHLDGGLLVVQGQHRGSGQDVGLAVALQGAQQGADLQDGLVLARQGDRAAHVAQVEAAAQAGQPRAADVEDVAVAVGTGEVGAADDAVIEAAVGVLLERRLPLDADLLGGLVGHLGHDRLDQHLGTPHVEGGDDRLQRTEHRWRRADDERVGFLVRLDGGAARRRRGGLTGLGCGGRRLVAQGLSHALQDRHQVLGLGVVQVHHVGVPAGLEWRVQVRDQRAHAQAAALGAG